MAVNKEASQDAISQSSRNEVVCKKMPNVSQGFADGFICRDLTLRVPDDFPTPVEAMDWLRSYTIANAVIVTVKVADGTYVLPNTIELNHPQGVQISLVGNQSDPSLCVLTVAGDALFDAVACSSGHRFGALDGFHITRPSKAEMPINTTGVLAVQNATIITGRNIKVSNWFYGIAARDASYIYCPNAEVSYAGDVGIWAFCGSTIVCNGSVSNYASASGHDWGFGFQAEFGSVLVGTKIFAAGCKVAGIAALSNSTCRLDSAISRDNVGSGLFARDGGVIEANGCISTGNARYGLEILEGNGRIYGVATNAGNDLGGANAFAFMDVAGDQARLSSSSGHIRIDSRENTYFNTPGGLQFSIQNAPSVVNHLEVMGSASGFAPSMRAVGKDTNIDLRLLPKGSGRIQVGPTGAGAVTPNSYIELLSSDGVVLRVPCMRM